MSQPPKQGGGSVSDVEREQRAERKRRQREERFSYADIVSAINTVANQLATNEEEQNRSDRKRGFREKVTIGLVLLTFAAAGMGDFIFYRTMMDGRDANAPIVSVYVNSRPILVGSQIGWTWRYTNYGKTAASGLRFRKYLKIGAKGFEASLDDPTEAGQVVFLPPTEDLYGTAVSLPLYNKWAYADLMKQTGGIWLFVHAEYFDTYHKRIAHDFCFEWLGRNVTACDGQFSEPEH